MKLKKSLLIVLSVYIFTAMSAFAASLPGAGETLKIPVNKTYHGDKFEYVIRLDNTTPSYSVYYLEYPGNNGKGYFGNIYAYYYVPADMVAGSAPRPGVVCLHIQGGNGELTQMICAYLATNGIPAIMCYMPLFGNRYPSDQMPGLPNPARLLGEAMRQRPADVHRTVDVMLTRPEVNPSKINMLGVSLGGITCAAVAGKDSRIDKAAIVLAGGNLPRIIGNSKETKKMREIIDNASPADKKFIDEVLADIDPSNNTESLKTRAQAGRLMMVNAAEDEVIPKECTLELVEKSGMKDKVKMYPGLGHYTAIAMLPQLMSEFVVFFKDETVPERKIEPPTGDNDVIRSVFGQLCRLAQFSPAPGKGMFINIAYKLSDEHNKLIAQGDAELLRGDGRKFKLSLRMDQSPLGSDIRLGFSDAPWIMSRSGIVYAGELDQTAAGPGNYFNPKVKNFQQLAAGMLGMAAGGMLDAMDKTVKITLEKDKDGKRCMAVNIKGKSQVRFYLKTGTSVPEKITFQDKNVSIEIIIRHWELDALLETAAFEAAGRNQNKMVKVKQQDLDRMMASVLNFIIEGM